MNISIAQTNALRGVAIIILLTHHYAQKDFALEYLHVFKYTGMLVCGLFFFLSGYGLGLNPQKTSRKSYWSKRFLTVLLPFILANSIYLLYEILFRDMAVSPGDALLYLGGIKLINPHCWFLQMLIVLYLCFFLFRGKNNKLLIISILTGGGIYIALTHLYIGISYLAFPAGIIIASRSISIDRRLLFIVLPVFALSFGYHVCNNGVFNNPVLILCVLLMISSFIMTALNINLKERTLGYLGKNSMSFYMTHGLVLTAISDLSLANPWLTLCMFFTCSVVTGLAFNRLSSSLMNLLNKRLEYA